MFFFLSYFNCELLPSSEHLSPDIPHMLLMSSFMTISLHIINPPTKPFESFLLFALNFIYPTKIKNKRTIMMHQHGHPRSYLDKEISIQLTGPGSVFPCILSERKPFLSRSMPSCVLAFDPIREQLNKLYFPAKAQLNLWPLVTQKRSTGRDTD